MRSRLFEQIRLVSLVIGLTLVSGLSDSRGFIHAANIWQGGQLIWGEVGKSALGFSVGIFMYWIVLKYMKELGIVAPEIQTVIWFGMTLVGVAIASGQFFRWQLTDQMVALGVLIGIGWLLARTGG